MKLFAAPLALVFLTAVGHAQCEVQKFIPDDGLPSDIFGRSVGVSGGYAVIGQPGLSSPAGSAYVYRRTSGIWERIERLTTSDGASGDRFGDSVAISGDTAVVGAPSHEHGTGPGTGGLYVFERTPSGWIEVQELRPDDLGTQDYIGTFLAMDGDVIVAGSPGSDINGLVNAGAAYVFERRPGGWVQAAKLVASDGLEHETFGRDVGVSGDTIVVGENRDSDYRGAVFVFERTSTGWIETAKLQAADGMPGDQLGWSVDIGGDSIVSGAPLLDGEFENEGAAYLFERTSGGWTQVHKYLAADNGLDHQLGYSVAIDGATALVGTFESFLPSPVAGTVHVLSKQDSGWGEGDQLKTSGAEFGDAFGNALDIEGATVAVGSAWDEEGGNLAGSAYIFDVPLNVSSHGFCGSDAPCGNTAFYAGCANESGAGARLRACGTTRVSAADLVMKAEGLPAGSTAVLFHGGSATRTPFGDGILLVDFSGRTSRFDPVLADINGLAQWDSAALANFGALPGETYWFQVWYTSPAGLCGSGTNMSSALRVTYDL